MFTNTYKRFNVILFVIIFILAACASPKFELYKGKELTITVLGTAPDVDEQQINFNEFTTDELEKYKRTILKNF